MTEEDTESAFQTWCRSCGSRSAATDLDPPNGRTCKRCGKPMLNGRDDPGFFAQDPPAEMGDETRPETHRHDN